MMFLRLIALISALFQPTPVNLQRVTLDYEGQTRTFYVYIPADLEAPEDGAPLVIALHPAGTTGPQMANIMDAHRLADQTGWVIAYPEGPGGYWDYGYGSPEWAGVKDIRDDPGFLLAMIEAIDADHQTIDRTKIAAVGFSNGGRMAHRLACDMTLAAVVAVSSSLGSEVVNLCPSESAPSVMIWHGTADGVIPFEGKPLSMDGKVISNALSTRDSVIFWARQAGCESQPTIEAFYTPPASARDVSIQKIAYACEGKRVEAYVAEGGGHVWHFTRQIDTSVEIWAFLADVMAQK